MPDQKSMKQDPRQSLGSEIDRTMESLACHSHVAHGKNHPILTNNLDIDVIYEASIGADEPFHVWSAGRKATYGQPGIIQIVGILKPGESLHFGVALGDGETAESAGITRVGWTLKQSTMLNRDIQN